MEKIDSFRLRETILIDIKDSKILWFLKMWSNNIFPIYIFCSILYYVKGLSKWAADQSISNASCTCQYVNKLAFLPREAFSIFEITSDEQFLQPELNISISPKKLFWPQPSNFIHGHIPIRLSSDVKIILSLKNVKDKSVSAIFDDVIKRYTMLLRENDNNDWEWDNLDQIHPLPFLEKIVLIIDSPNEDLNIKTNESYKIKIRPLFPLESPFVSSTSSLQEWVGEIFAHNIFGAMRGLETLSQIPSTYIYPGKGLEDSNQQIRIISHCPWEIQDKPRFQHRGLMLDTSRHYFSPKHILKILDGMSVNKLNIFHWHIVDAHSFPIYLPSLPELATKGAYSENQIYTPSQVANIVHYAKCRGIRVIPEFDMPGHACSWGHAYPNLSLCMNKQSDWGHYAAAPPSGQLNPVKNETYTMLSKLINDSYFLFNDSQFHIGSDEVNSKCWLESTEVRDFMKQKKIDLPGVLQYFIDHVSDILSNYTKSWIAWEDTVVSHQINLNPNTTILQVWKNPSSAKYLIQKGFQVICSFYTSWYLDIGLGAWVQPSHEESVNVASMISWQKMYRSDPTVGLTNVEAMKVLGGEVLMWTELVNEDNLETTIWPRGAAVAERLWSSEDQIMDVWTPGRLHAQYLRMRKRGIKSSPLGPQWCTGAPIC